MGILKDLFKGSLSGIQDSNTVTPPNDSKLFSKFDTRELRKAGDYYLLLGKNRSIFTDDLLALNTFLDEGCGFVKNLPKHKLDESKLIFTERIDNGTRKNVILSFSPLTKTGRVPKYPVVVHFTINIKEDFFGTVYYGQSKNIEKAEIVMWKKENCYIVKLAMHEGELSLMEIQRTDPITGSRYKVFTR